jgi:LysR family transcriptional regulator, hydrogen peroxide-inducible genes activator
MEWEMTLTELQYIVAVAQERHFGRASERVFVTQPALSLAIKKLEEELGATIFEKESDHTHPLGRADRPPSPARAGGG